VGGHAAVVEILLRHGAKPNIKTEEASTAWDLADMEYHKPTKRSNFQDFLPCLQTTEFGFEHIPSLNSLILITRDLMEFGVRHLEANALTY
jgi:hypothetical protein